jgi:predicted O-methyltransferase YrrM
MSKKLFFTYALMHALTIHPHTTAELIKIFPHYNDYKTINALPKKLPKTNANMAILKQVIQTLNPKFIIELGSGLGEFTLHMAPLVPEDGRIFAIDHWGQSSQDGDPSPLYLQFLSNVLYSHLQKKIIPVVGNSQEVLNQFIKHQIAPDFIYINAPSDEEKLYNDLKNYLFLVRHHGLMCGNNYSWTLDSQHFPVKNAIDRFVEQSKMKLHVLNNCFWFLTEI